MLNSVNQSRENSQSNSRSIAYLGTMNPNPTNAQSTANLLVYSNNNPQKEFYDSYDNNNGGAGGGGT